MQYRTIPQLTSEEIKRFWAKVSPPTENGCRLWGGYRGELGYGIVYIPRHEDPPRFLAHRIAYFLATSEQPSDLEVCHDCPNGDNPSCVEIEHLFLGTQLDNVRDAMKKGRMVTGVNHWTFIHPRRSVPSIEDTTRSPHGNRSYGERHGKSKLTQDAVIEIRRLHTSRTMTLTDLATKFKVCKSTIGQVVYRMTWTHI